MKSLNNWYWKPREKAYNCIVQASDGNHISRKRLYFTKYITDNYHYVLAHSEATFVSTC